MGSNGFYAQRAPVFLRNDLGDDVNTLAFTLSTGVFLYYSGKQVQDIKWIFIAMTALLLLMAAGQVIPLLGVLLDSGLDWHDELLVIKNMTRSTGLCRRRS